MPEPIIVQAYMPLVATFLLRNFIFNLLPTLTLPSRGEGWMGVKGSCHE
jgi:hypothetical protein